MFHSQKLGVKNGILHSDYIEEKKLSEENNFQVDLQIIVLLRVSKTSQATHYSGKAPGITHGYL